MRYQLRTPGITNLESEGTVEDSFLNFMVFVKTDYGESGIELREGDTDYSKMEKTYNLIKCQIHNSLDLGWKPEDIIIATNFEFEYMGVSMHIVEDICDYSQFYHKQYAALELLNKEILNKNFWYHDLDAFQLKEFKFPNFSGDWGTSVYPGGDGHSCQCGVIYLKITSKDMFEYLVDMMKRKVLQTHDDEVVIRNHLKLNPTYNWRVSVLNTRYNMGMTGFNERYDGATKPINVVHFSPDKEKDWNFMVEGSNQLGVKVVDDRLLDILNKYSVKYDKKELFLN